jgi:hypothetical protein
MENKKCLVCDTDNPDYATFCWKCKYDFPPSPDEILPRPDAISPSPDVILSRSHATPPNSENTYALREFLIKNQQLFMILGVFLAIALFFNTVNLLNLNTTLSPTDPTNLGQIHCTNQPSKFNCMSNFSIKNVFNNTSSLNETTNLGQIHCINEQSEFNCSSNFSTTSSSSRNSASYLFGLLTLLCLIPFILISLVIIVDSIKYLSKFSQYIETLGQREGLLETIKDLSVVFFIIPFIVIVLYFVIFELLWWMQPDYQPVGMSIFRAIFFIIIIIIILYLSISSLKGIVERRENLSRYIIFFLIIGIIPLVMAFFLQYLWMELFTLGFLFLTIAFTMFLRTENAKSE